MQYPTLLDHLASRPHAYPPEPVAAEKFAAMVALRIANTRMRNFYDLWLLVERMHFEGPPLRQAIEATLRQRNMPMPSDPLIALTPQFHCHASKQRQLEALLTSSDL